MSYAEIIGPNGKILPEYIDQGQTVPSLSKGQLVSGNTAGDYVVVDATGVPNGSILQYDISNPLNPSGFSFVAVPGAIALAKGELLTGTDSNPAFKLPAGPQNFVLTSNPALATGLQYQSIATLIQSSAPLGDADVFGAGIDTISIAFSQNTNGEIPVGLSTTTGSIGTLLPKGTQGQVLQCNPLAPNGTGLNWATLFADVQAGNNISIPDPQVPVVSLKSPLTSPLDLGAVNVTGTVGTMTMTDIANTSISQFNANSLSIASTGGGGISSVINKTSISSNNGANTTQHVPTGLNKLAGSAALAISNSVASGTIEMSTSGNTSNVNVLCPLKPNRIKDSTDAVGNAQYLSALADGSLKWAAAVGGITATPNANIVIDNTLPSAPKIGVISPLNAQLNLGPQNIIGSSSVMTLTNGANASTVSAALVGVADTVPSTTCKIEKTGITAKTGVDTLVMTPTALTKSVGATALTIANSVVGSQIAMTTANSGASDITTNCAFQPAKIRDSLGVLGTNGQQLTVIGASGALKWADNVSVLNPGPNIVITNPTTTPTIGFASPLNTPLALGSQAVTGNTSTVTLDIGTSKTILSASSLVAANGAIPATNSTIQSDGMYANTTTNTTVVVPSGVVKTFGVDPLAISHSILNGTINLSTSGGTSDVILNCPIFPTAIRDSTNSKGGANQVLTAGLSGSSLLWGSNSAGVKGGYISGTFYKGFTGTQPLNPLGLSILNTNTEQLGPGHIYSFATSASSFTSPAVDVSIVGSTLKNTGTVSILVNIVCQVSFGTYTAIAPTPPDTAYTRGVIEEFTSTGPIQRYETLTPPSPAPTVDAGKLNVYQNTAAKFFIIKNGSTVICSNVIGCGQIEDKGLYAGSITGQTFLDPLDTLQIDVATNYSFNDSYVGSNSYMLILNPDKPIQTNQQIDNYFMTCVALG